MISSPRKHAWRDNFFAGTFVICTALAGCSDTDPASVAQAAMLDAASATVTYRYSDSSIPPPGHLSYTLLVDAQLSVLTLDAYGENLGEQQQTTDIDLLDEVLNRLSQSDLSVDDNVGCPGGNSARLTVEDASGAVVREVYNHACGADGREDADELLNIIDPILSLFDLSNPQLNR